MIDKIEGFVIDIVKHNDKHNVVTLYTRTRGRMAFLVPVGKSKQGKTRNAIIAPMACLAADVNIRGGRELLHLRQPTPVRLWHNIYFNPVKSSILYFITELCNRILRQSPPDPGLWDFIYNSLEVLDGTQADRISNFHIAFLVRLLPWLGISPSIEGRKEGELFDMLSATMIDPGMPFGLQRRILLSPSESAFIPYLAKINYRNMHLYRLSSSQRQETLDGLIRYCSLHLPLGSELKTLDILRQLFI